MDFSPVWISLKTALTATAITFVTGILLARWRIAYRGKFGDLIDGLLILPLALPPTVVGLFLLMLLGRSSPLALLLPWNIIFSWPAAVIASFVVSFPLMYQTTKAAFKQIDAALVDLARIEGFSEWRILWQVMLPLAWPGLAAGSALSFVRALGEFGATLMIAGNIPGRTQTMPLAIFFSVESGERDTAIVFAFISVAISMCAIAMLGYLEKRH